MLCYTTTCGIHIVVYHPHHIGKYVHFRNQNDFWGFWVKIILLADCVPRHRPSVPKYLDDLAQETTFCPQELPMTTSWIHKKEESHFHFIQNIKLNIKLHALKYILFRASLNDSSIHPPALSSTVIDVNQNRPKQIQSNFQPCCQKTPPCTSF